MSSADLTSSARIREAAIALVSQHGWERTTLREIAAKAGVTVGLVNYHFTSKDGLREACDTWIMDLLSQEKSLVLMQTSVVSTATYLEEHPEFVPISDYIAMCLRHGGPVAQHIVDSMVAMTKEMLILGAQEGTMRAVDDVDATAALLVGYGTGATLLGDHIARALGGSKLFDRDIYSRIGQVTVDLFTAPLLTGSVWTDMVSGESPPAATPQDPDNPPGPSPASDVQHTDVPPGTTPTPTTPADSTSAPAGQQSPTPCEKEPS